MTVLSVRGVLARVFAVVEVAGEQQRIRLLPAPRPGCCGPKPPGGPDRRSLDGSSSTRQPVSPRITSLSNRRGRGRRNSDPGTDADDRFGGRLAWHARMLAKADPVVAPGTRMVIVRCRTRPLRTTRTFGHATRSRDHRPGLETINRG